MPQLQTKIEVQSGEYVATGHRGKMDQTQGVRPSVLSLQRTATSQGQTELKSGVLQEIQHHSYHLLFRKLPDFQLSFLSEYCSKNKHWEFWIGP